MKFIQRQVFVTLEHCVNYGNFTLFPGVEILWKQTVSRERRVICPKLCGKCTLAQNFNPRKLGEISVFYTVKISRERFLLVNQ